MNTTDKIMALADEWADQCGGCDSSHLADNSQYRKALRTEIEALVGSNESKADRIDRLVEIVGLMTAENKVLVRDNEALREKAEMHDAIQRACAELPLGADLHIELENGAGTVRLYLPDTDADVTDFGSDLTFVQQINAAIDAAMQEKQQ